MTNNPDGLSNARALPPVGVRVRVNEGTRSCGGRVGAEGVVVAHHPNEPYQAPIEVKFGPFDSLCFRAHELSLATPPASDAAVPAGLHDVFEQIFRDAHWEGWRGNQCRRDTADVDAAKSWAAYVENGALAKVIAAAPKVASDTGAGLPRRCDGKEQYAFEAWAREQRHDMTEHPLHYLFLDKATNAARQGWCAGLTYAVEQVRAALATDATDGATGGGEVAFGHCKDCPGNHSLMCCVQSSCGGDPNATTPGGDLLEQAASVAEEWAASDYDESSTTMALAIAADIRALSARNQTDDGGEKHGVR